MKVLQILPRLELGGVERGTVDLARALKVRGEQTVVVSSGGALVQELEREGIPHYTLPVAQKSLLSLSLVSKLVEIIQKERVDLVHARSRVPAWIAWFACREARVPFVTTCHGYYSNHLLSRVMGWGKRVIVPSQVIARHMTGDFGVPPERVVLIPRGVDLSQFPFQPEKYDGPEPKVFRILNLGRFSPIKGQVEFLRAIHRLRERTRLEGRKGLRLEVWLAGSEGEGKSAYTGEIDRTIQQLGLEGIVKKLGVCRDVPKLIGEADLLVLSSLVPESFGRVLIEAGARGTVCVASRLGGVLDVIEEGSDGILADPRNEEEMSRAIEEALCDRKRAKAMAHRFRKKVEEKFSLDSMADKTLEVYRTVRNGKKILVMKLGALGDIILAVPSLRMIRKKFPQARLSLMVDSRYAAVVRGCPYLDEVLPFDRVKAGSWIWLARFAKRLRREAFDCSVDFQNTKRTHFLAFLAGVPDRYGFRRGIFGRLLNHPDLNFMKSDSPVRHQFRILSHLGINSLDERLELWPDPDSEDVLNRRMAESELKPNGRLVGLAIGSSSRWPTKRWPLHYFRSLSERLVKELHCQIVLIGSAEDRPLAEEFLSKTAGSSLSPHSCLDWVGRTTLPELVALVKQLQILVTGDTAPLHIAGALGIKTLALFGPTDPNRHLPPVKNVTLFVRRLPCQPCYKGVCHYSETLACLKRIGPDEVFEAIRKHLTEAPLAHAA